MKDFIFSVFGSHFHIFLEVYYQTYEGNYSDSVIFLCRCQDTFPVKKHHITNFFQIYGCRLGCEQTSPMNTIYLSSVSVSMSVSFKVLHSTLHTTIRIGTG